MIGKIENHCGGLIALVVSVLVLYVAPTRADILDGWHWRNPTPFSDTMHSVCFGAGRFVAVGDGGVVHTSTDGTNWDSGQRPVVYDLIKIIYANGLFLGVGGGGSIITSANGTDWTVPNSGVTNDLFWVAYGNGKFITQTLNYTQILTSENGTDWTVTTNRAPVSWITFGNGVFVGAAYGGGAAVSSDGLTWTKVSLPYQGIALSHDVLEGAYGNGTFVAIVEGETNSQPASFFYSSLDGTNWVQKSIVTLGPGTKTNYTVTTNIDGGVTVFQGISDSHRFLGFLNGAFHEVTDWVNEQGFVNISVTSDGTSYTTTYAPTNAPFAQSMAYGNGKYVLIEQTGKCWVSTDETNWVAAYCGSRERFFQIAQGNGRLAVAGEAMMVSSDGMTFTNSAIPLTNSMVAVAYDGTNFVAVGGKLSPAIGTVATSTNGSDWAYRTSNSEGKILAVCHGAPGWVAVGLGGVISSPDTITWTHRNPGTARPMYGVTYGNGLYVAVGNLGTMITSSNGVAWNIQSSGTTKYLYGIVFQNGQFTAVGEGGTIITSPDGVNWTTQISGTTQPLPSIACGAGSFLVRGANTIPSNILVPQSPEFFLFSTDGTNWSDVSTRIPTTTIVRSIAYANQSFWIVGDNGMILQSDVVDGSPHLAVPVMSTNGGLKLNVTLNSAASYRVQFRTNFLDSWHDVYTNSSSITSDSWTDTNASQRPSGYYRIVSP